MPYTLEVVPGQGFMRLNIKGEIDMRAGQELLSDIAVRCAADRVDRVLLDVRQTYSDFRPIDLYELARALNSLFERQDRVAILHRPDERERAVFFVETASQRGWQVRAFDDPDAAQRWLGDVGTP